MAKLGHLEEIPRLSYPKVRSGTSIADFLTRPKRDPGFFRRMHAIRTAHAKSLRVIGQSLERAGVAAFEIENDGESYVLRSESLTQTEAWILRNSLGDSPLARRSSQQQPAGFPVRFYPSDISWLDAQAEKKRGESAPQARGAVKLSQLLRTLGDHLDRIEVAAFHVAWLPDSVSVDYRAGPGQRESRIFTAEKLSQLGSHLRFRRANPRSW